MGIFQLSYSQKPTSGGGIYYEYGSKDWTNKLCMKYVEYKKGSDKDIIYAKFI